MRRILVSGLGVALLSGVVGCGGSGVDAGAPPDLKPSAPMDPSMTDMTGKFGAAAASKAMKKNQDELKASPGAAPTTEAEKK